MDSAWFCTVAASRVITHFVDMTQQAGSINTRQVKQRRTLRFTSLDEMMLEAMRIAEAERSGNLKTLGNWTAGQTFGHIAGWMNYAFDGYPMQPPFPLKLIARLFKKRILQKGMSPGMRIPKTDGGTYSSDPMSLDEGLQRLSRAVDRLRSTAPAASNPMFGPLTHQQWIDLNLRHAELHLGFLNPVA